MNTKQMKKVALIGGLIAVLAFVVSVVGAQDNLRRERRAVRPIAMMIREVIQLVVDETGLTPEEIHTQLRDGATLAEILTANGGDIDAVVASAFESAAGKINEAVENGRITQAQADEMLANLEANITSGLNGDLNLRERDFGRPGRPVENMLKRHVLREAAAQTGLEVSEITAQLRDGSSLADVLTANDVDVTAFIDGLVTSAETHLSQAVENGRITQERADEMLANLREQLTEKINTMPEISI